jgi:hypothetical protein
MKQLKRMLRYPNGTRPMGITYGSPSKDNTNDIMVFSDSNWAADTTTMRLQYGEVVMLNGIAVSSTSKQQEVVALSTTKGRVCRRESRGAKRGTLSAIDAGCPPAQAWCYNIL